jgi:hypothetical protein
VLALDSCASAVVNSVAAPGPPAAAAAPAQQPVGANCPPIAAVDQILAAGKLLLLGEVHGTNEVPAFVTGLVCAAGATGLPVVVGLEIPRSEAARLAEFLDSDGGNVSMARLLGGEFWTSSYQDGRRSRAMADLLETLRRERARGGPAVVVAALDLPEAEYANGDRDAAMAERVRQLRAAHTDSLLIVLTGNVHNRMVAGFGSRPSYRPMGLLLADLEPLSLTMLSVAGEAWVCMPECGVHGWGGGATDGELRIDPATSTGSGAWHGSFSVGKLTPSLPAVAAGAGSDGR